VRTVLADLYLAMAQHRLGRGEQAAAALRTASEAMDAGHPRVGAADLGPDFHDYLFCLLARAEAEAMIRGKSASTRQARGAAETKAKQNGQ
jgi:hypothetical protein